METRAHPGDMEWGDPLTCISLAPYSTSIIFVQVMHCRDDKRLETHLAGEEPSRMRWRAISLFTFLTYVFLLLCLVFLSPTLKHMYAHRHALFSFQQLSLQIKCWSPCRQLLAQQRNADPVCKNTLEKKPHTKTSHWVTEWAKLRESCLVTYNWIPQHP